MTKASPTRVAKRKAAKDKLDTFVTSNGLEIKLKAADPVFVQAVIKSVKMPPKPTYETTTASGRVEVFEMDEVAAKQTPGGEKIWAQYQRALLEAQQEQADRSLRAIIYEGTEPQNVHDPSWERRMRIVGMPVSTDPDEKWVDYVISSLGVEEIGELSSAIMRITGVDEEAIRAAEDSFRDSVSGESEDDSDPGGGEEEATSG